MFQPTYEFGAIWRQGYQIWYLATNEYSNAMSARYMFQPTYEFLLITYGTEFQQPQIRTIPTIESRFIMGSVVKMICVPRTGMGIVYVLYRYTKH